jgi:hypothetical protein
MVRTSAETIAGSVIFGTSSSNNLFVITNCQITDNTMLGALIDPQGTPAGVILDLRHGTLLQGFQNAVALAPEVIYDGTSIIIDIDGDFTGEASLTITGEAYFSKKMDDLNANVTLELCLENWIGPNLILGDGIFSLTATATINNAAKVNGTIRGQGSGFPRQEDSTVGTVIDVNSGTAVTALDIGASSDGISIQSLQIRLAGAGAHIGVVSAASSTTIWDCYIRTDGSATKAISMTGSRCIVDQCQVLYAATITGPLIEVSGQQSEVTRNHLSGGTAVTTGISVTGANSRVQNNNLLQTALAMVTGISASSVANILISQNRVEGGAGTGTDGILLASVTDSIVHDNLVTEFTDGLDSDATCADNLYHGNNFQAVTNGSNKDASDDSTEADNRTN